MTSRHSLLLGLAMAASVLALDRVSKCWLLGVMAGSSHAIEILPIFNLAMVWNTGISFGMFSGPGRVWAFIGVSAAILAILFIWLYKNTSRRTAVALGAIIGGAVGNVVDRIAYGAVADFFDVHIGMYHWPAFNVADSAICIGVVVLCWQSMLGSNKDVE